MHHATSQRRPWRDLQSLTFHVSTHHQVHPISMQQKMFGMSSNLLVNTYCNILSPSTIDPCILQRMVKRYSSRISIKTYVCIYHAKCFVTVRQTFPIQNTANVGYNAFTGTVVFNSSRALVSPPPMSSRHRILEPGRWHATILM